MVLAVFRVNIPAMSTVGYGVGWDEEGEVVQFVGDHHPMRHLGEAVAAPRSMDDLSVVTDLDSWQFVCIAPVYRKNPPVPVHDFANAIRNVITPIRRG